MVYYVKMTGRGQQLGKRKRRGEPRGIYLDWETIAAAEALQATDGRLSFSEAICELVKRGANVASVPIVAGDLEDWRALAEREAGNAER
jgi:hypothetical protein